MGAPYVIPPFETGKPGFYVDTHFTPLTRDILNRFEIDRLLSGGDWCPGIVWDVEDGAVSVVNLSIFPVYVAMSVPSRSMSLSYKEVELDARDPEHRLGDSTFGGVLVGLSQSDREPKKHVRTARNRHGFRLTVPGARYRVAVGPPPTFSVRSNRQREYVLLVDSPAAPADTSEPGIIKTEIPAQRLNELAANERIAQALREWIHDDQRRNTRFWMTFREYQFIIGGFTNPTTAKKTAIENALGDMITEAGAVKNLRTIMEKHFDNINELAWVSELGLTPAMSRWLVDHHVLTVSDVIDLDNEMKRKRGAGWTSLFDRRR